MRLIIILSILVFNVQSLLFKTPLPEESMNTSALVKYVGYPCETHEVLTADGYYLTLFRIPHGKTNVTRKPKPVLLQHGLIDSSDTWVINLPHQSLAFILADQGFDVWLGNNRGNYYSKKHKTLSADSKAFWDFSFHEFAMYDIPAMIDYITQATNRPKIHYIGHSEGTMIGFAGFSENEIVANQIETFTALCPVASLIYIQGAIKYISPFSTPISTLVRLSGSMQFLPRDYKYIKMFADRVCAWKASSKLCASFIFLITGFDFPSFNTTRVPVYFTHTPAGTSVKNLIHFAQLTHSGHFRPYDYGYIRNILRYHSFSPPEYKLENLKVKVALFYSTKDWLSTVKDISTYLRPKLNNIIHEQILHRYNHMDFVWGIDAWKKLYPDVIAILNNHH